MVLSMTLREARERAELSQERLAAYAWVSVRTIRRIEQGLVVPNMSTRRAIVDALARRLRLPEGARLAIAWPAPARLRQAA